MPHGWGPANPPLSAGLGEGTWRLAGWPHPPIVLGCTLVKKKSLKVDFLMGTVGANQIFHSCIMQCIPRAKLWIFFRRYFKINMLTIILKQLANWRAHNVKVIAYLIRCHYAIASFYSYLVRVFVSFLKGLLNCKFPQMHTYGYTPT